MKLRLLSIAAVAITLAPLVNAQDAPAQQPRQPRQFQQGQQGGQPRQIGGQQGQGQRAGGNFLPEGVTMQDLQKIQAANTKVAEEKEVKAATDAVTAAQKKLLEVKKAAILKADPTLKDIFAKIPADSLLWGTLTNPQLARFGQGQPGAGQPGAGQPGQGMQRQRPQNGAEGGQPPAERPQRQRRNAPTE